ncbi:MAG: Gfo/Idh/MocA family oxidoreductase [Verrucomicrobia bacterium]|nr:Gfo/Idh/MocA family oxidoreductase [Verrucomicrobiota bacterium]
MNRRHFLATTALGALALQSRAADSSARLRVAVIGHTGRGNYGHGLDTMWLLMPETEIVTVADADAKGLEGALKKMKVTRGFADYHKMLAETKPDLVAIGPRHVDQHRDMILAAVESGARGIYIEKPFCRTPAEADELVAACERRKVRLAVAHRNRYHPVLPVLQKLIAEDAIGRVLEIRARGKEDQRGGSLDLWVLGSHLLNLATAFAGKPRACSATVLQDGKPVTRADVKEGDEGIGLLAGNEVHARFEMERGFPVFFDSVANAGVRAAGFGLQIIGTKGVFDFRIDQEPLAHFRAGNPFQPMKEPRVWEPVTTAGIGQPEPIAHLGKLMSAHVVAGRDLIAAIREGREPLCSVRDGAVTVEMICAVLESHRLGGQRVTFPIKTRQNPLALL